MPAGSKHFVKCSLFGFWPSFTRVIGMKTYAKYQADPKSLSPKTLTPKQGGKRASFAPTGLPDLVRKSWALI